MTRRDEWARQFEASARAHWTPSRVDALVGGKALPITPDRAPLLLRAIGLLHRDAAMPPTQHRKFLQVNHLAKLLQPSVIELAGGGDVVRVLDAGCGRSYLSLLLAWCAREVWGVRVDVVGVDRNAAVIAECARRAELAGLADVARFAAADLSTVRAADLFGDGAVRVDAVIGLHACDTATCDAIALGVGLEAQLIAVAPCCQAELARGWAALAERGESGGFAGVWRAPHLRRHTAAHVTDAMRAALLRGAGYRVTALEFVGAEHTAKNTLLRASRDCGETCAAGRAEYDGLVAATGGIGLGLAARI